MRFEERLLSFVRERHRERRARVTRAHMKQEHLPTLTGEIRERLTPINLSLHRRVMHLRHERLHALTPLPPPRIHILTHRALRNIRRVLIPQPLPHPLRGMPLLPRR